MVRRSKNDAKNTVIASFDVKSLFTQIPLKETIDICLEESFKFLNNDNENSFDLLTCKYNNKTSYFNQKELKRLLELAILDMHFLFNGTLYKQTDGVAMGSPLGPTLANAFMCHWEKKWLEDCPNQFKPLLYRRYVDDTFLIFRSPDHINLFLNYLNSKHENIEFTCDTEIDKTLPFLDINITREDSSFNTSIYRKPTFTGLLSKYSSFSPILYKKNLIATLVYRGYQLCSSYFAFHKEIEFLKTILMQNGYPLVFIEKQIKQTLSKFYKAPSEITVGTSSCVWECVPTEVKSDFPILFVSEFLGSHSEKLSDDLRCLFKKYLPDVTLRIIYKTGSTMGDLFGFKDKLPKTCMANFIYKYTCEGCNAFYIGKSYRQYKARVSEHLGISYRTNDPLDKPVNSDIRDHCRSEGLTVNPERFEIIDRWRYSQDLPLLESLHQKIKKHTIGTHTQSTPLLCFE